jgi:hypothetical protein
MQTVGKTVLTLDTNDGLGDDVQITDLCYLIGSLGFWVNDASLFSTFAVWVLLNSPFKSLRMRGASCLRH